MTKRSKVPDHSSLDCQEDVLEVLLYAVYLLRGDYKITANSYLSDKVKEIKGQLDHEEDDDLLRFIKSLTSRPPFVTPRS